jgi:MoxR-like ATPase
MDSFHIVLSPKDPDRHDAESVRALLSARAAEAPARKLESTAKFYRVDPPLATAINTALAVGAPLLVTGEPGTGKTQLASFLAWYFGVPQFSYQVRSTSTAQDLEWDFDAVAYLRWAQKGGYTSEDSKTRSDFLTPKALWLAYEHDGPSVVLIDEIDKAPRDFPNDLLEELDQRSFAHPFDGKRIEPRSKVPPIVIITSNAERRLPDAFLRRCVVHHLELTEDLVKEAVQSRQPSDFPRLDDAVRDIAIDRFWELRKVDGLTRTPATGELLVWLAVLSARGIRIDEIRGTPLGDLPLLGALIKTREDRERLLRNARSP